MAIPNNINPTCPVELYTKKRLKNFSENAPIIETIILKKAIISIKNCQIFVKLSKIFTKSQIEKKIKIVFEKIDKNVNVIKGDPP